LSKINSIIQFTTNKIKGKIAEDLAKTDYLENGFTLQKTGIGSDFIVMKKFGNTMYKEFVDVKSGNAQLSKKQKYTRSLLKKDNIPYSIYRVTDKYLEFQIKQNPQLYTYKQEINFSPQFTKNFVISDQTSCPNCKLTVNGFDSIFINFGLRNMGNGSVRVQSWCKSCRNYSRRNI
jgi:hypothetical protein